MTTHKLIPYWVKLRVSNNPGQWWDLDDIIYSPAMFSNDNIIDIFERFADQYLGNGPGSTEVLRDDQKTFTIDKIRRNGNTIQGIAIVGRWGEGADHFNVNNEDRVEGARGPDDSVEIPYYFLFHLPENNPRHALFMIHKPGNSGAKGPFAKVLKEWLHDTLYLQFESIVTYDLMEQIEEADRLLKLKLSKKRVSEAPHQRLGDLFEDERDVKQVVEFSARQGQNLPLNTDDIREKITGLLSGDNNSSPSTVGILEQEFNEAKLSIEQDGSTRTFSLTDDEINMQQILDPDDTDTDLSLDDQGHPTPDSMSPIAIEFANDILRRHQEPLIPQSRYWVTESTAEHGVTPLAYQDPNGTEDIE